jgi:hypothetical protein
MRLADLKARLEKARCHLENRTSAMADRQVEWEQQILENLEAGRLNWRVQQPLSAQAAHGAQLAIYNQELIDSTFDVRGSLVSERAPGNGLIVASGPNPDNETYTVKLKPGAGEWTALGIEVVQDDSLPGARVARGAERFVLTEVEAETTQKIPLILAISSLANPALGLPPMAAIDGNPNTGWGMTNYGEPRNAFLLLRFADRLKTDADSILTVHLRQDSSYRRATIGRFRLALASSDYAWLGREAIGAREPKPEEAALPETFVKALRTPETILARSNSSRRPSFLTRETPPSSTRSMVEKRWPQAPHSRRRRIPSWSGRESVTRVSLLSQKGQFIGIVNGER